MLSLLLCLKFGCTGCSEAVETTLHCEGQGVDENAGALVNLTCPWCGIKNQVVFSPDGTIHGVSRTRTYERIPEPSLN
jgi:hypothetical protein